MLRANPWAFAFVDGLHTYAAALQDTLNVGHAYMIAIDDVRVYPGVAAAFSEASLALERYGLSALGMGVRESYILPPCEFTT